MKDLNIPIGFQAVMPYLIVPGALKFIEFMKKVYDASETQKIMKTDTQVRHAQLDLSGSTIMCSDSSDEFPPSTAGMFVYVADVDVTYQKALNEGATSIMPPADQDYGRSCGVTDPFGNTWWITSVPE